MSKDLGPFMPFYVDDFIGGTMTFDAEEVGAYLLMLACQWHCGGIANDHATIERVARVKYDRLGRVLSKFEVKGGFLVNEKCALTRDERARYIESKQRAAKAGADARWHADGNAKHDAKSMRVACIPSPSPSPLPMPINKTPSSSADDGGAFDRFWSAYPRKVGKQAARKAWKRAKGKPRIDEIIAALDRLKSSEQWRKDSGQFIPHPATWINRGGWDDSDAVEVEHYQAGRI